MRAGALAANDALETELAALRERAYGADADIDGDAAAMARLAALEEWHARTGTEESGSASEPTSYSWAGRSNGDAGGSRARSAMTSANAGEADPSAPGRDPVRRAAGARARAIVLGAGWTAAIVAVAGGILLWSAPRPDAVLQATAGAPSEQVLRLVDDRARVFLVDGETLSTFDAFRGLEVWTAHSVLGNTCLLIIEPSSDALLAAGCVPPPATPAVEVYDVPVYSRYRWHEGLDSGSVARFVLDGDVVNAWVYEAAPDE